MRAGEKERKEKEKGSLGGGGSIYVYMRLSFVDGDRMVMHACMHVYTSDSPFSNSSPTPPTTVFHQYDPRRH